MAAAAIRGEAVAGTDQWPEGHTDWLSFSAGQGWVRRDTIAEITLVEFELPPDYDEYQ